MDVAWINLIVKYLRTPVVRLGGIQHPRVQVDLADDREPFDGAARGWKNRQAAIVIRRALRDHRVIVNLPALATALNLDQGLNELFVVIGDEVGGLSSGPE
jgi:hypothetical protein